MRILKMKVLTGTMLSLLLSAVSVYPAMARPTGKVESGQVIGQTTPSDTSPNNTTPNNTSPNNTTPNNTSPNNTTPSDTSTTDSTQAVRGTVKSIAGDVVTLQLPDGTTRDITFPQGQVAQLNLKPGTAIATTVDSQNRASKVSVIQSTTDTTSTTRTNRTRVENQVIRRRTVQTKPASAPAQSTTAPASESSPTPVRALW